MATVSGLAALENEYVGLRDIVSNASYERNKLVDYMTNCSSFEDLLYHVGVFIGATKTLDNLVFIYNFESFYQRNTLPFDTELINDNKEMEI